MNATRFRYGHVRQVDTDQRTRTVERELLRHAAADVAAVRRKAFVAQLLGHQPLPQVGDARVGHPALGRTVRETVTWQRRDHDV